MPKQTRRYWCNIVPITFQIYVVYGHKMCFLYDIKSPREYTQRAKIRYFLGPFTTSCEAQTRIVSQRRADLVIGGVRDTVSGPTLLFLLGVVTDTIRILTFR